VNVAAVFLVALGTALATGLGALPFVVVRQPGRRWLGIANALASGFMAGASAGLLLEGAAKGVARTLAGVLIGAVAIELARRRLRSRRELHVGALSGSDARKAVMIVGIMTVHSFTEGVAVGVSFGDGATLGLLIAIAIAVHNVPEGLAISLVLVPRGVGVGKAAWWSVFSSLPQPLMAVPAFLFVEAVQPALPVGLGFAAGAMLWMVAVELIPEALREATTGTVAGVSAAAALAILALQVFLL
jgi:zinc transporter ZupT